MKKQSQRLGSIRLTKGLFFSATAVVAIFSLPIVTHAGTGGWCGNGTGNNVQLPDGQTDCSVFGNAVKSSGWAPIAPPASASTPAGTPTTAAAAGTGAQNTIDGQAKITQDLNDQEATTAQQQQQRENAQTQGGYNDINSYNGSIGAAQLKATPEDKSGEDASCATGHQLGKSCTTTDAQIKNFQNIGLASQAVGASVVGITGQVQNMNAAQSGSQSGMIEAQANIQKMGAEAYMMTGAMNTAFGVMNMQAASKHDGNAKEFKAVKGNLKINDDSSAGADTKFKNNGYYLSTGTYENRAAGSVKDADQLNGITQQIVSKGVLSGGKVVGSENGGLEAYGQAIVSLKPIEAQKVAKYFPGTQPSGTDVNNKGQDLMQKASNIDWPQYVQQTIPTTSPQYTSTLKNQRLKQQYLQTNQNYLDGQTLTGAASAVDQRTASIASRQKNMNGLINSTSQQAATEQTAEADKARQAAITSLVQGVSQLAQGALTYEAAKIAEQEALEYNTGNLQPAFQVTSGLSQTLTPTNPTSTALSPGTGGDTPPPTNPGNITANSIPNLGTPVNPDATSGGGGPGPAANDFAGGVPAPGGGANGAGITVGATQPDKSQGDTDNSPRAAPNGPPSNYNSSGMGYIAGSGSVGADKGQDLSFLANLLPKKEDEASKNGILDFGNRRPASMAPYSLLGRDVNLFKRISDTMSEKAKSGSVGI